MAKFNLTTLTMVTLGAIGAMFPLFDSTESVANAQVPLAKTAQADVIAFQEPLETPEPTPMMSTCDPEDDLSQSCCDNLETAGNLESAERLAGALEGCDPGINVSTSDDCINATCNGPTSCKKLKKGCDHFLVKGKWGCSQETGGVCTSGTCDKCY